jgi:hypothetical protein
MVDLYEPPKEPEVAKLVRLMILRDQLLNRILQGLRDVDKSADLTLVQELEMLTGEAQFVSREIHEILQDEGSK